MQVNLILVNFLVNFSQLGFKKFINSKYSAVDHQVNLLVNRPKLTTTLCRGSQLVNFFSLVPERNDRTLLIGEEEELYGGVNNTD